MIDWLSSPTFLTLRGWEVLCYVSGWGVMLMIVILMISTRRTRRGARGIDLSKYMDRVEEDTGQLDTETPRIAGLRDWHMKVKWRK